MSYLKIRQETTWLYWTNTRNWWVPTWEARKLAIAKKKDLKNYPVSSTHFPSSDQSVTGNTFNQKVNYSHNGNSQKQTHPILYKKYNWKNKSTKMQCHWMGLHHHLSIVQYLLVTLFISDCKYMIQFYLCKLYVKGTAYFIVSKIVKIHLDLLFLFKH